VAETQLFPLSNYSTAPNARPATVVATAAAVCVRVRRGIDTIGDSLRLTLPPREHGFDCSASAMAWPPIMGGSVGETSKIEYRNRRLSYLGKSVRNPAGRGILDNCLNIDR